jgi:hypothetical protein
VQQRARARDPLHRSAPSRGGGDSPPSFPSRSDLQLRAQTGRRGRRARRGGRTERVCPPHPPSPPLPPSSPPSHSSPPFQELVHPSHPPSSPSASKGSRGLGYAIAPDLQGRVVVSPRAAAAAAAAVPPRSPRGLSPGPGQTLALPGPPAGQMICAGSTGAAPAGTTHTPTDLHEGPLPTAFEFSPPPTQNHLTPYTLCATSLTFRLSSISSSSLPRPCVRARVPRAPPPPTQHRKMR